MIFNPRAFLNHLLVSIAIVALFALLILTVWYPSIWSKALGGYELFLTVLIVDLIVGPLCMGFVYKSHKSTREKIVDVLLIVALQLGFLGYGIWVLAESRPAFIVFVGDRYETVVVNEIPHELLENKENRYSLSLTGPQYVGVDLNEVGNAGINYLVAGIDISADPQWYRPIEQFEVAIDKARYHYHEIAALDTPLKTALSNWAAKRKISPDQLSFLPVKHRAVHADYGMGFVTALFLKDHYIPDAYLQIDPYDTIEMLPQRSSAPAIELQSSSQSMGEPDAAAISDEIGTIIEGVEGGIQHYKQDLIGREMNLDKIESKIELRSRSKSEEAEALSNEIDTIIEKKKSDTNR